jgi:hypothetical protein
MSMQPVPAEGDSEQYPIPACLIICVSDLK